MAILDKIKKLTNQLYPKGRAFKMPFGGQLQKLRDGLAESERRFYEDSVSVIDSILPDNDDFSEADAAIMEKKYGMITNTAVALEDRKAAIQRKMNHPGGIKARQHYLFLQRELQNAGFDLFVHENLSRVNPYVLTGNTLGQHGDFQHGDSMHGGTNGDIIANKLYAEEDATFNIGSNYSNAFFIGGEVLGDYTSVDGDRETEFRQMVLRIKPANQIAFLLINYT